MLITDILQPESIVVPLDAKDKEAAIIALVDTLAGNENITDAADLRQAVLQREQTRTTGIGHGVAIPHGKCTGCKSLAMAIGRLADPIEFNAIDGNPVDLIFLLASPLDQTGPHIQALAAISRMLTEPDVRSAIKRAENAESLLKLINEHEAAEVG